MKNEAGFTLIEILVVVSIVAVVAAISSQIFLSLIRSNNKTTVQNEVRQNGNFAIDLFERDVRSSTGVSPVPGIGVTEISSQTVTLLQSDGSSIAYNCGASPGNTITRNGNLLQNNDNKTGVTVTACSFNINNANPNNLIRLSLTLAQASSLPARTDFQVSQKFEAAVSLRKY